MKFKASEITALTGDGILCNGDSFLTGIATDSGDVKPGDMFVCIKGERTDGHKYVDSAVKNGASVIFCDRDLSVPVPYIKVNNTVKSLQNAALNYRKSLDIKIVGVTGSVGKTTTKEFIYSALSSSLSVHKTAGNKNSETGVAITLLGIEKENRAAVVEMGMSNLGEISVLSNIALPDIGVITNIGVSHIENLKTRDNILKAKLEITDGMNDNSFLILNADDDKLSGCLDKYENAVSYGITNAAADFFGYNIRENEKGSVFTVRTPDEITDMTVNLPGKHNVLNALAAIAVGKTLFLPTDDIKKGLINYKSSSLRQNIYKHKDVTIYEDCYNSAPDSLVASVSVLKNMKGRKVAVLGDMLELGTMSETLHEKAGETLFGIDIIYLFGNYAENFAAGAVKAGVKKENIFIFSDKKALSEMLIKNTLPKDNILFKASRGMKAENIIKDFSENY